MSKERLKEFKDYIDFLDDSQDMQDHGRFVDTLHSLYEDGWFDWIFLYAIEQAERVEDNDQAIVDLNKHVEELEDENVDLEQQNKRYREALHLIMHQYELEEDIPDHDFMWNVNQIARKALKEE